MIDSRSFFDNLQEGEDYVSLLLTKDVFNQIPKNIMDKVSVSSIRQKNSSFKNDPSHKAILSKISKAKKELREYEFNINNK
jgi:hypothetical protein|tara:strand:- start:321 stop:563 length:243 start_codon:yes stop_codon:yes gene_type:complete